MDRTQHGPALPFQNCTKLKVNRDVMEEVQRTYRIAAVSAAGSSALQKSRVVGLRLGMSHQGGAIRRGVLSCRKGILDTNPKC